MQLAHPTFAGWCCGLHAGINYKVHSFRRGYEVSCNLASASIVDFVLCVALGAVFQTTCISGTPRKMDMLHEKAMMFMSGEELV